MTVLVGKILALASPVFAVGVVCFMLFATGYSYVSMGERAGSHESDPVEAASESGWVSAYEYSLEKGDYVYFFWSGFIVVMCLLAAGAALKGWIGLVLACAGLLGLLTILGAMSIGGHGRSASPSSIGLRDPTQVVWAGGQLRG